MGKALSGELSCPCDRSCSFLLGKANFSLTELNPFWKVYFVQEVMKVVIFVKIVEKHEGVVIHLNSMM